MALTSTQKLLFGAALIGAGIWLYRKFGKGKSTQTKAPEVDQNKDTTQPVYAPSGFSAYQKKVMAAQTWLKVDVDGIAGPQTNGQLKYRLPSWFAAYGNISETNIDKYLNAMQIADKAQAQDETSDTLAKAVSAIVNTPGVVRLMKNYAAPQLIYDKASNSYKATGKTVSFAAGYEFDGWQRRNRGGRSVLMNEPDSDYRLEFSPYVLIVV